MTRPCFFVCALSISACCALLLPAAATGQVAGTSVNMVSGTNFPGGDPFLLRRGYLFGG